MGVQEWGSEVNSPSQWEGPATEVEHQTKVLVRQITTSSFFLLVRVQEEDSEDKKG